VLVVGVDPAPTKGFAVFDGHDRNVAIEDIPTFVSSILVAGDTLMTWDAPLTGPPSAAIRGESATGSAFSQRPIESFFGRSETGFKTPAGISVRGYSGCPHWAVSRYTLGLPRVGPYDDLPDDLPFRLISGDGERPSRGCHVVEVHPAVAIWLWCRESRGVDAVWLYKKEPDLLREAWDLLNGIEPVQRVLGGALGRPPSSDDELDARVAYALGRLWLDDPDSVTLLGGVDCGAFLIPRVPGIVEAFRSFVKS
jgi:hypothetical protein